MPFLAFFISFFLDLCLWGFFNIYIYIFFCNTALLTLNSPSFCLSEKVCSSPSLLKNIYPGRRNLSLQISLHYPLVYWVSDEKSALNISLNPQYVMCVFLLAAFKIFSLSFILSNFNKICLGFLFDLFGLFWFCLVFVLLELYQLFGSVTWGYLFYFESASAIIISNN